MARQRSIVSCGMLVNFISLFCQKRKYDVLAKGRRNVVPPSFIYDKKSVIDLMFGDKGTTLLCLHKIIPSSVNPILYVLAPTAHSLKDFLELISL